MGLHPSFSVSAVEGVDLSFLILQYFINTSFWFNLVLNNLLYFYLIKRVKTDIKIEIKTKLKTKNVCLKSVYEKKLLLYMINEHLRVQM